MTRSMGKRFRGANARRDANEPDIIEALERRGCVVHQLEGEGVPDLLVWVPRQQRFILVEVKDGAKPKSAQKLKLAQIDFHQQFTRVGAPVFVVSTVAEAVTLVARRTAA